MKLLATLATAFAGVLGFLYILQVNAIAQTAYRIEGYEKEKNQLSDQNTTLEASAMRVLSANDLEDLAGMRNFEKARDISYLKITEPAVAKSK